MVDDLGRSKPSNMINVLRSNDCDDIQAGVLGELDRVATNVPSRSEDHDPLTRFGMRVLKEHLPRCDRHDRDRSGF